MIDRQSFSCQCRVDWAANKKPVPWFIPSINPHHSKISHKDWHLSPADTNLNKGSHTSTNLRTGTSLSLLEAVAAYVHLFQDGDFVSHCFLRFFRSGEDCLSRGNSYTPKSSQHLGQAYGQEPLRASLRLSKPTCPLAWILLPSLFYHLCLPPTSTQPQYLHFIKMAAYY